MTFSGDNTTANEKEYCMKHRLDQTWHYHVIIALLLCLVATLLRQLHTSRDNERELSRRIYQTVRTTK